MSDDLELIEALRDAIDGKEAQLTDWETDFVESVLRRDTLTERQREIVEQIMEKL